MIFVRSSARLKSVAAPSAMFAAISLCAAVMVAANAGAQAVPSPLDPVRTAALSAPASQPLPEEYIWTAGDVTAQRPDASKFSWVRTNQRIQPHLFRAHFQVGALPSSATLYLAGPRWAKVYLNGALLGEFSNNADQPINFHVFHVDATHALRSGDNVIAIEAIRGRADASNAVPASAEQLAYGEVLVVKLLAGRFGDANAPALLISNRTWKSQTGPVTQPWQTAQFDDSAWHATESIGPVESSIDFRQWSADAGMYGWPGYSGVSSFLRTFTLPAVKVTHVYAGAGSFEYLDALTSAHPAQNFTVTLRETAPTEAQAPTLLLDFGREIAGRVLIESASAHDALVSVAYGESDIGALSAGTAPAVHTGNFVGENLLDVPANAIARGPKSAFRYVRLRFLRGAPETAFKSIRIEGITYPVHYEGSFESSDAKLNRIWETAAYTAHLCMQDDIWDAPKRDRGRWAGDLNVESSTILTTFGDTFLLEDTLRRLGEAAGPGTHVNGIPGYTAQWVATLWTLYQDTGDRGFVVSQHDALLRLLHTMDGDLDPSTGLLKTSAPGWWYVDWAPRLYGDDPASRTGSTLEFLRAYQDAPALLRAAGDNAEATHYEAVAAHLRDTARAAFLSSGTNALGDIWQLNAMAVLTNLDPAQDPAIWTNVFAHVKQDAPEDESISPYYNAYVLDAMAADGHPRAALHWMRDYWGGMLDEGATSFWEGYDLRWPKDNFHLSLQADNTSGYIVSLAHGWASGPAAWLVENVLGVRPAAPGYTTVELRPNLLGLAFAHGTVATPHGPIAVSMDAAKGLSIDLPKGIESARLFLPSKHGEAEPKPIEITHSGHYHFALP